MSDRVIIFDTTLRDGEQSPGASMNAGEKLRLAMNHPDEIEIDFELEDGAILTIWLGLDGQEAQKSHGLCKGRCKWKQSQQRDELRLVYTPLRGAHTSGLSQTLAAERK